MQTNILKMPEAQYTEEDVKRSVDNAEQIAQLEAETPEVRKQYNDLGKETAAAQDMLDDLKKRHAFPEEIRAAEKAHQQAVWRQKGVLAAHDRKIRALQSENEKLSFALRLDTHSRWLDEAKALAAMRTVEVLKTNRDIFSGAERQDILTNAPVIAEAKEQLITAIQQLGTLQFENIPTIAGFIDDFESELRKLDLSKVTRWDDVLKQYVDDIRPQEATGEIQKGMLMPDGSVHIHPSPTASAQINQLSDRLLKLEGKGKS
jgi:hypothetical protein